ncbi:MAG: replication endonuclease [Terriglobales bacterium]
MPTIQQEIRNGETVKTVAGLPFAWGVKAYEELRAALDALEAAKAELKAAEDRREMCRVVEPIREKCEAFADSYETLCSLLDKVTTAPIPLDATDAHLIVLAERYAGDCATQGAFITEPTALRARLAHICAVAGIEAPTGCDDKQAIFRCNDPLWWRSRLRKLHARTFEAAAIRLGMVSSQKAKYCSDETVVRRIAQNRRNAAGLESVSMMNMDTEQVMTLAELARKGMGNKKLRRMEMMMRMAGCDKIAQSLGHMGLFVTLTAPSAYHAVLHKTGDFNPKFNGATPIDTHNYLNNVWVLTRAKNDRDGIAPYGFRVAEPHHDGCTHWHMLVFMPAEHIDTFIKNLSAYALAEDGDEYGAQETRVKFEQMDPKKGGAAAYMAKYVSKNIDDEEQKNDLFGKPIITTPMRVDAWAGCWGIRQFQPFGQPPVTVYREFRRIEAEHVQADDVPEHIKLAHAACQRIESKTEKDAEGKPIVLHRADWSEYVAAQGGVKVGKVKTKTRDYSGARVIPYSMKGKKANRGKSYFRGIKTRTKVKPLMSNGRIGGYAIGLYAPVEMAEGRYGLQLAKKPRGVFCQVERDVVYKSTRYTWKKTGRAVDRTFKGVAVGVGFDVPWSPVNNCTESPWAARPHSRDPWSASAPESGPVADFEDDWWESEDYRRSYIAAEEQLAMLERSAAAAFDQDAISREVQHWRKYV